ncbi:hypothetical protein VTJ83DRAFT_3825 [Remersonia thermophila]|uniref:Conidiation-specific protein 6 n=1 Tax=Remersonia thermophila TaxID=72144 RepID=A0ABR4DHE4_9PEZI
MSNAHSNRERGLRAALNNPRVSEEAKQHDRELLASEFGEHMEGEPQPATQSKRRASSSKKGAGAKVEPPKAAATEAPPEAPATTGRRTRRTSSGDTGMHPEQQVKSEEKDKHNVIRGLKAALKNPNVSEKAKEADRKKLAELGEPVE